MLMTLRHKVLGSLLVVLGLFILLASFALYNVQRPFFEEIERDEVGKQLDRVLHIIEDDRKMLERFLFNWYTRTDTLQQFSLRNWNYFQANLAENNLGILGLNMFLIVGEDGEIIWGEVYEGNQGQPIEALLPYGNDIFNGLPKNTSAEQTITGFVETPSGPALISAVTIPESYGSDSIAGHMIAGVLYNSDKLQAMNQRLAVEVDLTSYADDDLTAYLDTIGYAGLSDGSTSQIVTEDETIRALTVIQDLQGRPFSLLKVSEPREIIALGQGAFHGSLVLLVCVALVVLATIWILMRGMVLSRIEQLTRIMLESREEQSVNDFGTILDETIEALKHWRAGMTPGAREDEIGQLVHAFENLSMTLQETTHDIWKIAHLDNLTSLPNRRLYFERLYQQVEEARNTNSKLAVLFLDLDDFKNVNDGLGHNAGDEVLKQVAGRIKPLLNLPKRMSCEADVTEATELHQDMVARIGGDEFVVMLMGDDLEQRVDETAAKIVREIDKPFHIKAEPVKIGASVGIAVYPHDGESVDNLVQHADIAMYAAKQCGKNAWQRYDADSTKLRSLPGTGTFRQNNRKPPGRKKA